MIAIGADHGGYELKEGIKKYFDKNNIDYKDYGTYTPERTDLYAILTNIDLYLNTYPLAGALMTQYAAIAKKIPLTLKFDDSMSGLLFNQKNLEIEFDEIDKFKCEVNALILNADYRHKKEELLGTKTIISESHFTQNLKMIIEENCSLYKIDNLQYSIEKFQKQYLLAFGKNGFEKSFARRQNIGLIKYIPRIVIKGIIIRFYQAFVEYLYYLKGDHNENQM